MKDLSKKSKIGLTAVLAVGCAALLYSSFISDGADETIKEEAIVRAVKVATIEQKPATQLRRFPAVLEPPQLVPLSFEVGGRVTEVDLRLGQLIKKGELLATIEPLDLDIRVNQAKAGLDEAKTVANNAKKEADRQESLFKKGITTAARRDQAVTNFQQANLKVAQAQSSLDLLQESRSDAELRAPFDAVINDVTVQDFVSVQPGQPIVSIYQEGKLQASILVSFDVAKNLKVGREVNIVPADEGIKPLVGTISEIGRRAPAVSSFPVIITIPNDVQTLLSGMAVDIQFDTVASDLANLFAIPRTALKTNKVNSFDGKPPFSAEIYILNVKDGEQGALETRQVLLAGATEDSVLVAGGIQEGDQVVTAGVPFLREGQIVKKYVSNEEGGK